MPYLDEIIRVTLPQVRAQFTPRVFASKRRVRLVLGQGRHVCEVEIAVKAMPGSPGRQRRWFTCPRCTRNTCVVGFDAYSGVVGCRGCFRWRTRPGSVVTAPHARAGFAVKT